MKTPVSFSWMPGLLLAMAGLPVGLAQNQNTPTPTTTVAAVNSTNMASTVPRDIASLTSGAPTASAVVGAQPLPSELRLSPWTKEIVKLAQSGIDEDVMLSFIDNSGVFNLGADQVIYLSDLGVSSQIVSEMLKHDREVMAGIKPVTITTELASEVQFPAGWKTTTGVTSKANAQPTTATAGLSAVPGGESLASAHQGESITQPAVVQCAMMSVDEPGGHPLSRQPNQSSGKESIYRVRESHPVELLPPIVFMNEVEQPANTIIILGFPRTTLEQGR